jgi:taurine dioxygenase
MNIELHPIKPFGVEVRNLDPRMMPSDHDKEFIKKAFAEHHFILIRGFQLSEEEELRFTQILGPISVQGDTMNGRKVMYISNAHAEGVLPDGEILFHSDHTFFPHPLKAIALHAMIIPSKGGETVYADTAQAYQNLPDHLKERIANLQALHLQDYALYRGDVSSRELADTPGVLKYVHPIVRTHALTGKPLLFVNRLLTHSVVGLPKDESDALLDQLLSYIEDPKVHYRHQWLVNDYLIWDNVYLQHARTLFDPAEKRVLRRVPISGGDVREPFAVA